MISYKAMCTLGSAVILVSTSFIMGVFYSNLAYDYKILFQPALVTAEDFERTLKHYQFLNEVGQPLLYILSAIAFLGLVGHMVRLYKPNEDLKLFEYASLGMFVMGICVFITNIKTGIECSLTGNWGEVTENQGIAVLGSSNIILLCVFLGVLLLQAGLWWANYDLDTRMKQFYAEEAKEATAKKEQTPKKGGKKLAAQNKKNK
ncbi:similar to Saccharomyces cerevisiae YDL212W SHR3 Endoplasmic reticulum packaging chaperone [Maudiozyma saulgeensis]|uniref:Similar to Saccharomyces cerevisiae YDL212W SHR3 Endoplasmic reticulum packaging chaperone n=1 Tax=Maudiozyma saulgeensis TaxID=1789683 RepID=A0A1X7R6U4_9SACH|nr:similar to Saccharomyces cerevisiae YDL212W SHR3 Endoplasmic reticulum packaging chaperone [Kazachstania saulgeensis]